MSQWEYEIERLDAELAAVRQRASDPGRELSDDERARLNALSIERAAAWRALQAERAQAGSYIVSGGEVFRQADRRRQRMRLLFVGVVVLLLVVARGQHFIGPDSTAADTVSYGGSGEPKFTRAEQALLELLPPDTVLPEGFSVGSTWAETASDTADFYLEDHDAAMVRLVDWGFEATIYRWYELDERLTTAGVDGVFEITVQLTRFGSVADARAAAAYERDDTLTIDWAAGDARELPVVEPLGNATLAVVYPEATFGIELSMIELWVVDGPLLYHYSATASEPAVPDALLALAVAALDQQ